MKRVRINHGKIGLVYRKGDYNRTITYGNYWLSFGEVVQIYDLTLPFIPPNAIEILLEDEKLNSLLHHIEVGDNEIVIVYENEKYKNVLTTGTYFYWNILKSYTFNTINIANAFIEKNFDTSLFNQIELNRYIRTFEVFSYEKAVLLVDDKYIDTLDSGVYRFWKNETSIKIGKVDVRQLQLEISGQEILTKDKAAIRINFNIQYQVISIEKALLENKDFEKQLYTILQLALRAYIGSYTLDELLEHKNEISEAVFNSVKEDSSHLGVKIYTCGIKDIILTGEMREIMNQVLIAQKKAQANVITRREETASTRSLLNTAKLMEENDVLFKLKEMEYVEKIAEKIGEITVSGNGNIIKQLKEIFSVNHK
ncbi:slipin family protein [Zhouia sp. PK063]|uniref:slipin family protein n=1 Tax=Zhouia sp. PK063 TaxID=3373602 RepID=UPI0037B637FA